MRDDDFYVEGGVLRIAGQIINTGLRVVQAIRAGGRIIVRLEPPPSSTRNDNVACYDNQGKLLWTIQPSPHGGTSYNPYMLVYINSNLLVCAQNWNGVEYQINIGDGTVSAIGLQRF